MIVQCSALLLPSIAVHYNVVHFCSAHLSTVHCSAVQLIMVEYSARQYGADAYSAVQCRTVQMSTVQYSVEQYSAVDCIALKYSTLQCAIRVYFPVSIFWGLRGQTGHPSPAEVLNYSPVQCSVQCKVYWTFLQRAALHYMLLSRFLPFPVMNLVHCTTL